MDAYVGMRMGVIMMDNGAIRVVSLTAIAGVIGTGLGASLKGFWSSKLGSRRR